MMGDNASERVKVAARRRTENLLGALALSVQDSVTEAFEPFGLQTLTDPAALIYLLNSGATLIGALARALRVSPSSMVRVADRLVGKDLVARVRGSEDGREVALNLTPAGRTLARRALKARNDVLARVESGLSHTEVSVLESLLGKMLARRTTDRVAAERICRLCDEVACMTSPCPVEEVALEHERRGSIPGAPSGSHR